MVQIDTNFYIFGGQDEDGNRTDVWELSGTGWEQETTTNPPPARHSHSAIALTEREKMFVLYGEDTDGNLLNDIWEYCGTMRMWRQLASEGSAPSARSGHTSVYLPETDKVWVFGGTTAIGKSDELFSYDVNSSTWTRETPLAGTNLTGHGAFVDDGKMVIFGGLGNADIPSSSLFAYTPGEGWDLIVPENSGPSGRSDALFFPHEGQYHVVGGISGETQNSDHWCFDPETSVWSRKDFDFPVPISGSAVAASGDTVVVFGGDSGGMPTDRTFDLSGGAPQPSDVNWVDVRVVDSGLGDGSQVLQVVFERPAGAPCHAGFSDSLGDTVSRTPGTVTSVDGAGGGRERVTVTDTETTGTSRRRFAVVSMDGG